MMDLQEDFQKLVMERDTLKSQLQRAVDALEFYADKKNWQDRWVEDDEDNGGDIFDVIDISDVAIEEDEHHGEKIVYRTHGGEKAREALSALRGEQGERKK